MIHERKSYKFDFIIIKIYSAQDTDKRRKDWEKIFSEYRSDKGFVSEICMQRTLKTQQQENK